MIPLPPLDSRTPFQSKKAFHPNMLESRKSVPPVKVSLSPENFLEAPSDGSRARGRLASGDTLTSFATKTHSPLSA